MYIVYVLWRKKTSTHFEILGYFSQQIFFQKQKVAGMNLFVYAEAMWAFTFACLTWMFESERRERRVGVTVLDIELRRENWTSRRFHTDYFNIEYLFWTWLTSFKSRHFKLSIHICLMYLRWVFTEIQVVLFPCLLRKVTETEPRQRTHPVYFINFRKAHYFVVIMTIQK